MKPNVNVKKYNLEKDSFVEVHKVFGDEYYFAVVELNGRYPEKGRIAHDVNRSEYIYLFEGEGSVFINEKKNSLKKGESILVEDGDRYYIEGKMKVIVFVKDGEGGTSAIEDLNDE